MSQPVHSQEIQHDQGLWMFRVVQVDRDLEKDQTSYMPDGLRLEKCVGPVRRDRASVLELRLPTSCSNFSKAGTKG